jgi:hypothetical protein
MRTLRLRHCLFAWTIWGLGFVKPATERIQDNDVWWHIRTGELIVAHRAIPRADPFSFTCHGRPWFTHEWLSEVAIYEVFAHFGFIGLMLMEAVLVSALFGVLYVLVRGRLDHQPSGLAITALCGLAGWQLWSPRPQLFTYLLLGLLILLLQRRSQSRHVWLAVPMFLLWSNLHGAWIFGFAVITLFLAEEGMRAYRTGHRRIARRDAAIWLCSLAAVMIGPSPLQKLTYPMQYFTGAIPTAQVTEFHSPNFRDPSALPFELLIIALVLLLYLGRRPMPLAQWILLGLTFHLSLSSVRHIPLFAIIAAPAAAMQVQAIVERRGTTTRRDLRESRAFNLILLMLIPALLIARIPKVNDEDHCVERGLFPSGACRYLSEHPRIGRGRLLNTYNWGGYLIFRLCPKYLVSVDGRADVHRRHMMRDYDDLEKLSPNWRSTLTKLNPDVILWPSNKPLAVILRGDPGWRVIYQDDVALVFARIR